MTRAVYAKQRAARVEKHAAAAKVCQNRAKELKHRDPAAAAQGREHHLVHVRHCTRLRSCAGEEVGTGMWAEAQPDERALQLTDSEFAFGARWRLGPLVMHAGPCQHQSKPKPPNANAGTSAAIGGEHARPLAEGRCGRMCDGPIVYLSSTGKQSA